MKKYYLVDEIGNYVSDFQGGFIYGEKGDSYVKKDAKEIAKYHYECGLGKLKLVAA